ncbi:hypothetical protein BJ875DRAFT_261996 [Amylocarpus encephaloides]|uniref:Uncharacterized protein n=1 Tax=Amylocarpus encephaloides TaxID=45428 RepID=A0A9P7YSQ0_9HELO|nr:hypothetical protein BJ875DRAFT_261996 [Amylocarpus encephaloides]
MAVPSGRKCSTRPVRLIRYWTLLWLYLRTASLTVQEDQEYGVRNMRICRPCLKFGATGAESPEFCLFGCRLLIVPLAVPYASSIRVDAGLYVQDQHNVIMSPLESSFLNIPDAPTGMHRAGLLEKILLQVVPCFSQALFRSEAGRLALALIKLMWPLEGERTATTFHIVSI